MPSLTRVGASSFTASTWWEETYNDEVTTLVHSLLEMKEKTSNSVEWPSCANAFIEMAYNWHLEKEFFDITRLFFRACLCTIRIWKSDNISLKEAVMNICNRQNWKSNMLNLMWCHSSFCWIPYTLFPKIGVVGGGLVRKLVIIIMYHWQTLLSAYFHKWTLGTNFPYFWPIGIDPFNYPQEVKFTCIKLNASTGWAWISIEPVYI